MKYMNLSCSQAHVCEIQIGIFVRVADIKVLNGWYANSGF